MSKIEAKSDVSGFDRKSHEISVFQAKSVWQCVLSADQLKITIFNWSYSKYTVCTLKIQLQLNNNHEIPLKQLKYYILAEMLSLNYNKILCFVWHTNKYLDGLSLNYYYNTGAAAERDSYNDATAGCAVTK